MNTKHTPGPWIVCEPYTDRLAYPIGRKIDLNATSCFAEVNGTGNGKANAKLIAAAPDLLEALQACVDRMAELQKHTNYPLAWPRVQAMAAIEKATK